MEILIKSMILNCINCTFTRKQEKEKEKTNCQQKKKKQKPKKSCPTTFVFFWLRDTSYELHS